MKKSANQVNIRPPDGATVAKLSPIAADLLRERSAGLPIWIRAPRVGREFFTGFTRAALYEMASAGRIRTCSVRKPGRIRGTRLFHLGSILAFIESQCP